MIFRIVQAAGGLLFLAYALCPASILQKFGRKPRHQVERILIIAGGLTLLVIGIWGERLLLDN